MRATGTRQLMSNVTSLESSYARIFRDDTAEPTTNVAEDHNDVPQAADLLRGVSKRGPLACAYLWQTGASQGRESHNLKAA